MKSPKQLFYENLTKRVLCKPGKSSSLLPSEEYIQVKLRLMELKDISVRKNPKDYHLLRKYQLMDNEKMQYLLSVQGLCKRGTHLMYVCAEDLYDVIHSFHCALGHKGRNVLYERIGEVYANVTNAQIGIYLDVCRDCRRRKQVSAESILHLFSRILYFCSAF